MVVVPLQLHPGSLEEVQCHPPPQECYAASKAVHLYDSTKNGVGSCGLVTVVTRDAAIN